MQPTELAPSAALIAVLVNPGNAQSEIQTQDVQKTAGAIGQRVLVLEAGSEREIEAAFATLVRERADAFLVAADVFFTSQPALFVVLTARHAIPGARGRWHGQRSK